MPWLGAVAVKFTVRFWTIKVVTSFAGVKAMVWSLYEAVEAEDRSLSDIDVVEVLVEVLLLWSLAGSIEVEAWEEVAVLEPSLPEVLSLSGK